MHFDSDVIDIMHSRLQCGIYNRILRQLKARVFCTNASCDHVEFIKFYNVNHSNGRKS